MSQSKLEQMAEDYANPEQAFDYPDGIEVDAFLAGARAALALPEVVEMRETLADIIRNSHDIVAKKLASQTLAAFDKLTEGV